MSHGTRLCLDRVQTALPYSGPGAAGALRAAPPAIKLNRSPSRDDPDPRSRSSVWPEDCVLGIDPPRLPVHTVTGFLGSGKSTLLNRLLRHPEMGDSAVIVNEFGEIGIDHALVETVFEDTVLMRSGCLCCTLRGDLVDTLCGLGQRVDSGELPAFARVLIETTGLADPGPVLQTLLSEPLLTERYRAGLVVATVDALHGPLQHENQIEFSRQVAAADRIVLTKTDLASDAVRRRTLDVVRRLNPAALLLEVGSGAVEPARLFGESPDAVDARTDGLARWAALSVTGSRGHAGGDAHRTDVHACCLYHDEPLEWMSVRRWLESVVSLRGDRVLRIKGLVNVRGEPGPIAVHAVQHVLHPAVRLEHWPDDDHRTRLVFITRSIDLNGAGNALRAACAAPAGRRYGSSRRHA